MKGLRSQDLGAAIYKTICRLNHYLGTAVGGWHEVAKLVHEVDWIDSVDPLSTRLCLPSRGGRRNGGKPPICKQTVHQNAQRYFEEAKCIRTR